MQVVAPRLGNNIDHCARGLPEFCGKIAIHDLEFFYGGLTEVIWRAIAASCLSKEGVVVVDSVNLNIVIDSSEPSECEIAVGSGGQSTRIRRDSRR